MSGQSNAAGSRRRTWWIAGAALLSAAVVVVLMNGGGPAPGPAGAGTPSGASSTVTSGGTADSTTAAPADAATEPGSTGSSVPEVQAAPTTAATLSLDGEGALEQSVTAHVVTVESVQGVAVQPGEVGGPALRVTVEVRNETADVLDLRSAVVNLYYGSGATPASPLSAPGSEPFPLSADAGASVSTRLVFAVPDDESRDRIRVEVDLAHGGTVLVFEGAAPR
ncbi:MAG: hypothetical protein ACYCTH_12175 [Cellulomonas sp.]